jgi:hypothetical protein
MSSIPTTTTLSAPANGGAVARDGEPSQDRATLTNTLTTEAAAPFDGTRSRTPTALISVRMPNRRTV